MSPRKRRTRPAFDPPLDEGVRAHVEALVDEGVETFESCDGTVGHAFPEPTVRFHGGIGEGFRALAAAIRRGLPVASLRRTWSVVDEEPTGPHWELTFRRARVPVRAQSRGRPDGGG